MPIILGPVKPWVSSAANEIISKFGITTAYGVRPDALPDHPTGHAVDFMVFTDRATGDALAAYVLANGSRLGVTYVIWYQRIWDLARGDKAWRAMSNRGGTTANHKDHVHVTFNNTPPTGSGLTLVSTGVNSACLACQSLPDTIARRQNGEALNDVCPDCAKGGDFSSIPGGDTIQTVLDQIKQIMGILTDIDKALLFLVDPHNWLRMGMAIGGGLFILIALFDWEHVSSKVGQIAR